MIVSDHHCFVFVENPLTGSTAIARELETNYGGRRVIRKHALLAEFLRVASPPQRDFFVFTGVRNPLDAVVSRYEKLQSDHKGNYSRGTYQSGRRVSEKLMRQRRWLESREGDFDSYLKRYHRIPYTDQASYERTSFDFVYRFEDIGAGFDHAIRAIGLEPVRPLPAANPTEGKGDWRSYYGPAIRDRIPFLFGPFLDEWGYRLPDEWNLKPTPAGAGLLYRALVDSRGLVKRRLTSRRTGTDPHYLAGTVK